MPHYQHNELMAATDVAKKFGSVLQLLSQKKVAKIGVLKNNKLEAVIIPTQDYERMQKALEVVEQIKLGMHIEVSVKPPKNMDLGDATPPHPNTASSSQ